MTGTIDPNLGTHQWNPFAVGQKRYGAGLRTQATTGPVSAAGKLGYQQRDQARQTQQRTTPRSKVTQKAYGLRMNQAKPRANNNLQIAAARAEVARRYGKPYPGTTPRTGA